MNYIKFNDSSKLNNKEKNIAILTNDYLHQQGKYEGAFIFQGFDEYKEDISSIHINYLENNFFNTLKFYIIDQENINIFKECLTNDFQFDLIIIHKDVFYSNFFDLDFFKSMIKITKQFNIKIIFDICNDTNLISTFYDDSNYYLLRTVTQTVDIIVTSNDELNSNLINFNDYTINIPSVSRISTNPQDFFKQSEKWSILLKSVFKNHLILDVVTDYYTEIAEYYIVNDSNKNEIYKISVIIPIYNTGKKLRRCLKSIEYQTIGIENIEVILVNDCSNDETTLSILNEFALKNSFKWINLKENQGHSGIPRNIGILESSAEYIMFMDHDDFFEISALEKLYNEMVSEERELDLIFGTYTTVENEQTRIYFDENDKNGYTSELDDNVRLITFPPASIWTKLFKKEFIIKNNILFPNILGEDAIFMNKSFLNAKGIKYLQRVLIAFHDLGKTSITNNVTLKYLRQGISSEQYLKEYLESNNVPTYFRYRVDVLANFFFKKFINQSKLTETEIRLIFPKYWWAMNQIKIYGSDLLFNKEIYEMILAYEIDEIIKIKLGNTGKQNILYVTISDETESFPLIDSLDQLLEKANIYAITYSNLRIKLWYCNLDNFILLKEITFNDKIPNFNSLNNFYNEIFEMYNIEKLFFRQFGSYQAMFYYRSMIQTPRITPVSFASEKNIPTVYGENSKVLLNKLDFKYQDNINVNPILEKGVVYTAIFGDYEDLLDPKIINENLDYVCFTDNPNLKSDIWEIRLISDFGDDFNVYTNELEFIDLDYTRRARTIKILPHVFLKEYDFSIWVDAGFLITGDIIEFINRYSEKDFLGIKHSVRNCLYDEAKEVLRLNLDDNNLILNQIENYKNEGYPKNYGLIESGILFRRHNNPKIVKVMDDWFNEVLNYSKRDQISFNYVAWKNNLDFDLSDIYYARNEYFHHYFHKIKTINNKVTLKEIRIILLDNGSLDELKLSIDKINKINDYIPISIITINKNICELLENDFYNLEVIYTEKQIMSKFIDTIISKKYEKYVHVMNAGEILNYDFILKNI